MRFGDSSSLQSRAYTPGTPTWCLTPWMAGPLLQRVSRPSSRGSLWIFAGCQSRFIPIEDMDQQDRQRHFLALRHFEDLVRQKEWQNP